MVPPRAVPHLHVRTHSPLAVLKGAGLCGSCAAPKPFMAAPAPAGYRCVGLMLLPRLSASCADAAGISQAVAWRADISKRLPIGCSRVPSIPVYRTVWHARLLLLLPPTHHPPTTPTLPHPPNHYAHRFPPTHHAEEGQHVLEVVEVGCGRLRILEHRPQQVVDQAAHSGGQQVEPGQVPLVARLLQGRATVVCGEQVSVVLGGRATSYGAWWICVIAWAETQPGRAPRRCQLTAPQVPHPSHHPFAAPSKAVQTPQDTGPKATRSPQ